MNLTLRAPGPAAGPPVRPSALKAARAQALPPKQAQQCPDEIETRRTKASRRQLLAALPPVCGCAACSGRATAAQQRPRNALLDASFAQAMAEGMADYELSIAPVKRQLFEHLLSGLAEGGAAAAGSRQKAEGSSGSGSGSGGSASTSSSGSNVAQLLELGVGTGPNLQFYADFYRSRGGLGSGGNDQAAPASAAAAAAPAPTEAQLPALHITGIDCNQYMRPFLEESLQRSGWPARRFSWVQGDAAALPLADASMDAAVCTLVLCSVPDVGAVLAEAARVLRPGGQLLFIEHTTARQGQPLLWLAQRALEPLQRLLADNCHLTRDPLPAIEAAFGGSSGRGSVDARRFSVEGAGLIAPHVAGLARRSSGGGGGGSGQDA